jgi:hypothetical protein
VIKENTHIEEIAGAIDLLPTLTDLTGIEMETNKPVEGRSLEPLLFDNDPKWGARLLFLHWRGKATVRSQQFRLDNSGRLFNIVKDRGQYTDVAQKYPEKKQFLQDTLDAWRKEVTEELHKGDRPFPVGHPEFKYTQLPARDANAHGNIERSNRYPNCTFFRNWTATTDKITWNVEVLSEGDYTVDVYYTCPRKDTGSTIELSFGSSSITGKITEPHDPPLQGMEHDRVKRIESYVKSFKPLNLGTIHLEEGTGRLTLKALDIPGEEAIDFRLLMFRRMN